MTGREAFEERFGFKARGEFRVRGWFEVPLTMVGLIMLVIGPPAILNKMADPDFAFGGTFAAVPLALLIWAVFWWWIVRIAHSGVTCRYEADEKEFRITDNKHHTVVFYYTDIVGVDYAPIKYLNRLQRGFKVTVRTKYRNVTYCYIVTKAKFELDPESTPFFILESHSGLTSGIEQDGTATRT